MKFPYLVAIFTIVLLLSCNIPVSADPQEVTYRGQVATVNPIKNTLSLKVPAQYGCAYQTAGEPVCKWTPVSEYALTGRVPDPATFSIFSGGEGVIATGIGGDGGEWITLAKIYGKRETEQLITDIVGEPNTVPLPLMGNYSVDTELLPNCSACTGDRCDAKEAKVTVKSFDRTVLQRFLNPGDSLNYDGRNDGSELNVRFISGRTASASCPGSSGTTGTRVDSVFIISSSPPTGYNQVNIRTATTTRPDEALTVTGAAGTIASSSAAVTADPTTTAPQTPSADLFSLTPITAVFCAIYVIFGRH